MSTTTLHRVESRAQRDTHADQIGHEAQQFDSPWLTSREACAYLRYAGKAQLVSLYRFLKAHGIATARRGGRLLIARRDLDRAIGARRQR